MNPTLKLYGSIALVVATFAGYLVWRKEERAIGAAQLVGVEAAKRADSLATELVGARAAFRVDTLKFMKILDHRDSLLVLTGALDSAKAAIARASLAKTPKPETVTVRVPASVLVTDDSTIHACKVTLAECGKLTNIERERGDALQLEVTSLKRLSPDFLSRHASFTVGYGAVEQGGKVIAGPGVLAGWRVWP